MVFNEGYIFGSEQQGIGGETRYYSSTDDAYSVYTEGAFRVDGLTSESTTTPTGTLQLDGFASTHMSHTDGLGMSNYISITSDRLSTMSGSIWCDSTYLSLSFGGDLGSSAAYITDNTFAALDMSGTMSYVDDSFSGGWLIAIDTDIAGSDATTATPGISWGLWGVDSTSGDYDVNTDFWVAGVDQITDNIADIRDNVTGTYVGNVMGTLNHISVLDPLQSTITLDIDFNAGTIGAKIDAVTVDSTSVTIEDTFTSVDDSTKVYSGYSNAGSAITGSFYNGGATTAGTINLTDTTNTVSGVYKAAKQ